MNTVTAPPAPPRAYPVHVDADLDPDLSRGLWLVKWLLAIPHYIVLAFLWVAFVVTTIVAFFAILVTGRYPRSIFEFNVGVMRWSWRVSYYAYGALATDRYPPFTLADVPDYPAHLSVDYPEHLSRGLALVKWWLLAIPHYVVLALLVGGVGYGVQGANDDPTVTVSLIGILVLVAGVLLLFTGRYPQPLFDLVLGLNRWVLRVAGYVSLMTDRYPPFSLEQGGHERTAGPETLDGRATGPGVPEPASAPVRHVPPGGWSAGRVTSLVAGCLLVLSGLGLAGAGLTLVVADQTHRDADGFLMSPVETFTSDGYAITSGDLQVHTDGASDWFPEGILGDVRISASSTQGSDLFLGIARTSDVTAYLADVQHDQVVEVRNGEPVYRTLTGGAPASLPQQETFWVDSATGTQPRLTWSVEDGDWTVVLMTNDSSTPVTADLQAGAEVPVLATVIAVLLILGALLLLLGGVLVLVPIRAASRQPAGT